MYQSNKLTRLLSEKQIRVTKAVISQLEPFFNKEKDYSDNSYYWRSSIALLYKSILNYQQNGSSSKSAIIDSVFNNHALKEVCNKEAERMIINGTTPLEYLSFLKIFRKIVENIVLKNSTQKNKAQYLNSTNSFFDSIEYITYESYIQITKESTLPKSAKPEFPKAIINSTPVPLLLISPPSQLIHINKSAKEFFGDVLNNQNNHLSNSIKLNSGELLINFLEKFHKSKTNKKDIESSLSWGRINKQVFLNVRKLKNTNYIILAIIDITSQKQVEEQLKGSLKKANESNHQKTIYLANMSHEIRTPLNSIIGFSELLAMLKPSDKEKHEYISLIRKSSKDLLNIIEDVIDVAKIEAKQLKIVNKPTKPAEVLSDLYALFKDVLLKNNKDYIRLHLCIPEKEENILIRTDPKRLKQVLSNLIGNAVKFTEKGEIEIGYKLAENKLIYFYVKDTGIGIPYKMQPRIFEQFTQVEESYLKNTNGTGLGLAISKNIVQLLGGEIWVSSVPQKGSNFYFYLPYIGTDKKQEQLINNAAPIISKDFSGTTVLVAEDEDVHFFYLIECLKGTGIKLIRAKNGEEAISIAEKNNEVDLILMDIRMPEINGIDAIKYIKKIKPHIPIIAQSAYVLKKDRQACLDAGCYDYISKPININTLNRIIRNITKTRNKVEP